MDHPDHQVDGTSCIHDSELLDQDPMRILVVDDHEAVRRGVCAILGSRQDIEVCAQAANGREAIDRARESTPDVIILDITMPVLGGFAAALEIAKLLPEARILFFSMHETKEMIREAKRIGVHGFVTKDQAGQVLLNAVDAVFRKQTFFPPD
jgi:DNA-binding NarL/FixJ family response regulator